jgi:hypothetical protein
MAEMLAISTKIIAFYAKEIIHNIVFFLKTAENSDHSIGPGCVAEKERPWTESIAFYERLSWYGKKRWLSGSCETHKKGKKLAWKKTRMKRKRCWR